ncbi:geranylgeranyl bacteriochlorophyll reductase-like protein [Flavobacterium noncentrifugens]|uniref:Dehydrogenase (Flavoprotein) n=1 Tax=Flavobacterium noncentrifugens TaxID=1128970 RepID=A0A1G8ZUT4_9FLAO|nr:NAD(P)/FAD-dependent oxidoreductase [Flavobacterium noncentrifugens]GEP51851.1 geranylgeranyl bacteriochlorophyll reductase-like protein [Flavobacterium noncentrifugens]SDK17900.1 Dehydrogenase (flavoprotein) [Flavobacterium noncentrifugens]
MDENNHIIIVGGGLAGLTSAIHLSKNGFPVTVIDKNKYPRHKVCGEYISNEVLPYLDWLGINPEVLHPTKIREIIFSTGTGKIIHGNLPLGGFGISRFAFDHYLFQKAVSQNCKVVEETVTEIDFSNDEFLVTLSNNEILKSKIVIGAFGKRSNLDQKMHRDFIVKKSPWLAVKGHYKGNFPDETVGLHNFKGGYCGVSKVENDTINICYLADFETFKQYKNLDEYQKNVVYKNPVLKAVFENATAIFEKPLTISQISFDKKKCVENRVLMVGDTAGLIHPLCGNGMAMAIHSAKIVSESVTKYLKQESLSRESLEKEYHKSWNSHFSKRLKMGRFLGKLLQQQRLSEILIRVFVWFPALLPMMIRQTHGELLTTPQ